MLIFNKKEKRVVKLVLSHIEKTAECVRETTEIVKSYAIDCDSNSLSEHERIYDIESEADGILREIRDLLYSGAYLPAIRGDIYRLMSCVDGVSNKAEGCFEFFANQTPDIPGEFRSDFASVLEMTNDCFSRFQEALEAFFAPKEKIDKVRKLCREAGELESRIDQLERNLSRRIFSSTLEKAEKIHLSQALRRAASISDSTENAADELQLISLKSII